MIGTEARRAVADLALEFQTVERDVYLEWIAGRIDMGDYIQLINRIDFARGRIQLVGTRAI